MWNTILLTNLICILLQLFMLRRKELLEVIVGESIEMWFKVRHEILFQMLKLSIENPN